MTRIGNELVFDRLSIDGAGPGTVGLTSIRNWHGNLRKLKVLRAFASAARRVRPARIRGGCRERSSFEYDGEHHVRRRDPGLGAGLRRKPARRTASSARVFARRCLSHRLTGERRRRLRFPSRHLPKRMNSRAKRGSWVRDWKSAFPPALPDNRQSCCCCCCWCSCCCVTNSRCTATFANVGMLSDCMRSAARPAGMVSSSSECTCTSIVSCAVPR